MKFQNAWVSDRSLCYLASGKPVVVQDTGPSSFLPNGEGIFRWRRSRMRSGRSTRSTPTTRTTAACSAPGQEHFDAEAIVARMLELAL